MQCPSGTANSFPKAGFDWQRPFRDGRAMPFTRTGTPHQSAGSARLTVSMRGCEGKELEHQPRRVGAIRGLEQSREIRIGQCGRNEVRWLAVLKAPVVGPLARASLLGADDACGVSPRPRVKR